MSGKSRSAHLLGRALRIPAALDRPGIRWLLQLLSPPPAVIILVHRGRRSGKLYKTPLSILAEDPERREIFVSPMWSRDADWYRNVAARGRSRGGGAAKPADARIARARAADVTGVG